jgi:crotonobetainyl-CoA:carnitine CoA-transferase CaiB-like acyl-CoA transferase
MTLLADGGVAVPRLRAGQGDHMAGLNLLAAVLAALLLRERTGAGHEIEVSLLQTSAWFVASDLAATLIDRAPPPRTTRSAGRNPLLQYWATADDRWLRLGMRDSQSDWRPFCRAIGHPEWEIDPRFDSPEKRTANLAVLNAALDAVFRSAPLAQWRERLDGAGLAWETMLELHEVIDDPQVRANPTFAAIDHPHAGRFETVATPFHIAGADIGVRGPAPELGADTDAVLHELGLTPAEIARLRQGGVVSGS